MKKYKVFSLAAGCIAFAMISCNNSGDTSASNDSTATDSTGMATTANSTGSYAARADSVKTNVSAGNYINPKTGKAYTNINVDPNTGTLTDENGAPVRRFVDRRTWWVYDTNNWDTVGSARMMGSSLTFRNPNGKWVTYEKVWVDDMDSSANNQSDSSMNNSNDKNPKVKVSDNGNKIKIKKKD